MADIIGLAAGRNIFDEIWKDQQAFNDQLRTQPETFEERSALTKELVLHMMSESDELLRTTIWKSHRKMKVTPNLPHTLEELVDIFKCWMTLAQIWGYSVEDIATAYYAKSMVCRQRFSEEWMKRVDRPTVVVDIDSVLCDYITGITAWVSSHFPRLAFQCASIQERHGYVNAKSMDVAEEDWATIKHMFRVSGAKRRLPVFPDALPFLQRCRDLNYCIVLLTSRPIDRYPNIYTDTLVWLNNNDLPYDFVWWSDQKGERIIESDVRKHIKLVVDDDVRFVTQVSALDIPTIWLQRYQAGDFRSGHNSRYVEVKKDLIEAMSQL